MPEIEAANTGTVDPTANLDKWLEKREAEPASTTGQSQTQASPAEPETVAQPEATQPSWREVVLGEDVGHDFLKGKKVADVVTSWEHAQRATKEAQQKAAEAQRELDAERRRYEAELAARKIALEQKPRESQPGEDPRWAEVDNLWFTDNKRARTLLAELNREEAQKIADQKFQEWKQEADANDHRKRVLEMGGRAYDAAREKLNLPPEVWNERAEAILLKLTNPNSKYYGDGNNVYRTEAYLQVHNDLWGAAPIVARPAVEPPTPPGAKKPVPVTPATPNVSPLDKEEREARRLLAKYAGIDADRFIKRGERARG